MPLTPIFGPGLGEFDKDECPTPVRPVSSLSPITQASGLSSQVAGVRLAHVAKRDPISGFEVSCLPAADAYLPLRYAADIQEFEDFPLVTLRYWRPIPDGGVAFEWPVNGGSAVEIITAVCSGPGHNPPLCGFSEVFGCSDHHIGDLTYDRWRDLILDVPAFIRIGGVYKELKDSRVALTTGLATRDHSAKSAVITADDIYPAAGEEGEKVPVYYWTSIWILSENDQKILTKRDPAGILLKVAHFTMAHARPTRRQSYKT